MGTILQLLKEFLPVEAYQTYADYDVYELFDKITDEQIGMYTLNTEGELASFSLDGEAETGDLLKNELVSIAEKFIQTFHPDKKDDYELSAIIDLNNPYMISYEKREGKFGLFLHSEGFTVSVSTTGQVQQFFYEKEEYQIIYPENIISEGKALEKYMKHLQFELLFTKFDKEIFANGDNQLHLSYSVNEQAFDIPADGREPALMAEGIDWKPISFQEVPSEDFYHLVGITKKHKQLQVMLEKNMRIELWSMKDATGPLNADMEEVDPHLVKLCFDLEDGKLLKVTSGEPTPNNGEKVGVTAARQKALDLIFKLFHDAHERFRIEVLKEDADEEDDVHYAEEGFDEVVDVPLDGQDGVTFDEGTEVEDYYTFYFHLMHNDIRVDDYVTIIGIGKYSGKVNHFQLNVLEEDDYLQLTNQPAIPMEEAKKIYKDLIKMELLFVREYDENFRAVYTLSYGPSFPDTIGHVRALDAITGKAMFVDVGDATFY